MNFKKKLNKILKENKTIAESVDMKNIELLSETIDIAINEETERRVKVKMNEEVKKIKSVMIKQNKKDIETFKESLKNVENSNLSSKLDIVCETFFKMIKESVIKQNDSLVDEYVSEMIDIKAKQVEDATTKKAEKIAMEFLENEKELMKEFNDRKKHEYFVESVLGIIKNLEWEDKLSSTDNIKKLVEDNKTLKNKYKKLKSKSVSIYKDKIFNEHFSEYTDIKKLEIKKILNENIKEGTIEEYKKNCKKILESKSVNTILSEGKKKENIVKKQENKKIDDESWKIFLS